MTGFDRQTTVTLGGALWLAALLFAGPVSGQQGPISDRQGNNIPPDNDPRADATNSMTFEPFAGAPGESDRGIKRAEQAVHALHAEGGVYARTLADALVELGLAYRHAGQHENAETAFLEALQVARVNHGLHDFKQLPYLDHVIDENATLGQWDRLAGHYDYLYTIHKRNYGDQDPRLLAVIERVVLEKLAIARLEPASPEAISLQQDLRLLDEAIEIIELHYHDDVDRMTDALYLVARTNYAIAEQTGRLSEYARYRRASRTGTEFIDHEFSPLFGMIAETERDGRSALKRIEELFEENAPSRLLPRARVIARQGDWQQLYQNGSGRRQYKRAYNLLEQSDEGQKYIARLFGKPLLLPAMDSRRAAEDAGKMPEMQDAEGNILELAFDVAASGTPQNTEIRAVPGHLENEAQQWRRLIETWRFRPRMEQGEPVSTRLVQRLLLTGQDRALRLPPETESVELVETEY